MLDSSPGDGHRPKCFFTSSRLPAFVNHDQIPSKKRPFSMISGQPFSHSLDLVLPQEHAESLQAAMAETGEIEFAKAFMKPIELLEGEFFNHYIKTGNILMLSEGRPYIDRIFTLVEGVLRLEVDKATFERMGLEGKAISTKGRKHVKARYAVELNLRLPSMVRGKKGFERILWAFKNVLDQSVAWLFYDLRPPTDKAGPIAAHQPIMRTVRSVVTNFAQVVVPTFPEEIGEQDGDVAGEILEWLRLATMECPRLQNTDRIDTYLSKYEVPTLLKEPSDVTSEVRDLVHVHWHGLLPPRFIQNLYLATLKVAGNSWFSMHASAFDGSTYMILQDKQHTMTWEQKD